MTQPTKKLFVALNILLVGSLVLGLWSLVRQRNRVSDLQQPPGPGITLERPRASDPPSLNGTSAPLTSSGIDMTRVPPSMKLEAILRLNLKEETALSPTQATQVLAVVNEFEARVKAHGFKTLLEFRQFVTTRIKIVMGLLTQQQITALEQIISEMYSNEKAWTREQSMMMDVISSGSFKMVLEARAAKLGSTSSAAAPSSANPHAPRLVPPVSSPAPQTGAPRGASPSGTPAAAPSHASPGGTH